eukprot:767722-Hanusia_phi.AAC.1
MEEGQFLSTSQPQPQHTLPAPQHLDHRPPPGVLADLTKSQRQRRGRGRQGGGKQGGLRTGTGGC